MLVRGGRSGRRRTAASPPTSRFPPATAARAPSEDQDVCDGKKPVESGATRSARSVPPRAPRTASAGAASSGAGLACRRANHRSVGWSGTSRGPSAPRGGPERRERSSRPRQVRRSRSRGSSAASMAAGACAGRANRPGEGAARRATAAASRVKRRRWLSIRTRREPPVRCPFAERLPTEQAALRRWRSSSRGRPPTPARSAKPPSPRSRAISLFSRSVTPHSKKRRDLVLASLSEIEGITCPKPEGAFYV